MQATASPRLTRNVRSMTDRTQERDERDVSIGPDHWLPWVDLGDPATFAGAARVDHLLRPSFALWDALETHCVAGCCGISAFNLWPDAIRAALESPARKNVAQSLREAQTCLSSTDDRLVVSERLNQYLHRELLLQILDHICAVLEEPALGREMDGQASPGVER